MSQPNEQKSEKLLFTVEETAQKLSISRDMAYKIIKERPDGVYLRSVKIGNRRRVSLTQINAYIARLEATNA